MIWDLSARPARERLLASLARRQQPVLRIPEDGPLVADAVGASPSMARRLVKGMDDDGLLVRVRRGLYVVRTRAGTLPCTTLDLVGWASPPQHEVTGLASLAEHDLTDQRPRAIDIAVPHKIRGWDFQGQQVRYMVTTPARFQVRPLRAHPRRSHPRGPSLAPEHPATLIAHPARTIVDCLHHRALGVSITQAAQAVDLYLARDTRAVGALLIACAATVATADSPLVRRLGYLIDVTHGAQAAAPFLALVPSDAPPAPLIRGDHEGPFDEQWRLTVSTAREAFLSHRTGVV